MRMIIIPAEEDNCRVLKTSIMKGIHRVSSLAYRRWAQSPFQSLEMRFQDHTSRFLLELLEWGHE